ncbi:AraC family transcriptional regulator [Rhodococcus sp. 15-725-2-2b]|uniref:GlxA family transcriptional regulator n=1 Tax=unclassified Rhodococcus (in: high G+C Gram-positive bacteria) TaxID=192944 RepID=UPI0005D88ADC|nr:MULTISPECIES: DJ-1/PfpI family protein [unclassified Rhodococcus (in: high G+C Gram-positive bacteria)]AJW42867.1 Transcriptional regulator containing an amidase domain and an AraC-type DNA-binding HTH domain [Rhodococcus sp. B7740]OZC66439.1 AraC family transcriptional regulator [Rhodococcus sp. 06-469-3-2]OZD45086.1 AraC family transcriptional regulator [Rhodococcus sp. 06-1477-1A]OZE15592.1 AraC family transcriptional regulator [Rhodococcus sp. 05-2255-3B1]OZE16184.1 AraC family transcri
MDDALSRSVGSRRIAFLVFDGVKMLDFVGPAEVFVESNQQPAVEYEVVILSPGGGDVSTSIGTTVSTRPVAESGRFDTVIIAGSEFDPIRLVTAELVGAAADLAARTRRMASVCTGAFVLAAAGLLDGRRATTHWKFTSDLQRLYPALTVDPDAIFVRDGRLYSSAGVAAGIDLALALVEDDHGPEVARAAAQGLLVYMQRGGGQSQFSSSLSGPIPRTGTVRRVADHIRDNPRLPHTVAELARFAALSTRQLTRLFQSELGSSPAEFVASTRFELAREALHTGYTVGEASRRAGYSSCEVMRRAFVARIGTSPRSYQQRFAPQLPMSQNERFSTHTVVPRS